jgi:Family of unknown function (DUF5681)
MSGDYQVGRGKPPVASRFRKGQSGNPKGRPRKAKPIALTGPSSALLSAPTFNAAVLADGARQLKVNGDIKSMREAVIQAMGVQGVKGGVLAGRTYLNALAREEAKLMEARRPDYEFWRDYKAKALATIEAAIQQGETPPEVLPHPDDIAIDHGTLLVEINGPVDTVSLREYEAIRHKRDLLFELMAFTRTWIEMDAKPEEQRIGVLGAAWFQHDAMLPKRMRSMDDVLARIERNLLRGDRYWEADLRRRCDDIGLPFDALGNARLMQTVPMKALGMRFENNRPVPATAKTRRQLQRMMERGEGMT